MTHNRLHITPLLAWLCTAVLTLGGCAEEPSDAPDSERDAHRFSGEGAVDVTEPERLEPIKDASSLLHADRMKEVGFELDWGSKLMQGKKVHAMHILDDSILLETRDHQLHALDRYSGHYKWVVQLTHPIDFHPTLMESSTDKDRFIFFVSQNYLYAIDVTKTPSGRELGIISWKILLPYTASTPPHANDFFVAIGCEERNFVLALQIKEIGKEAIRRIKPRIVNWKRTLPGRLTGTPASTGDKDDSIVMVATANGQITGLSFNSGAERWSFPSSYRTGPFTADLLIHDDMVFAACEDHHLYALERSSGSLMGKIALDSPLTKAPWVVGQLKLTKDQEGTAIIKIDNDMDVFAQTIGSPQNPEGRFYHIRVSDVVEKNKAFFENSNQTQVYRRWEMGASWSLEGQYSYLFRTRTQFFVLKGETLVVLDRDSGKVVRSIPLGDTQLIVHYDPENRTDHNRLFVSTREGGVYSLQLRD